MLTVPTKPLLAVTTTMFMFGTAHVVLGVQALDSAFIKHPGDAREIFGDLSSPLQHGPITVYFCNVSAFPCDRLASY